MLDAAMRPQATLREVQQVTADFCRVSVAELLSQDRARCVARPRQMAMQMCREFTNLSLPQIGRQFGNRDHTTVLHASRRMAQLENEDPLIRDELGQLRRFLGDRFATAHDGDARAIARRQELAAARAIAHFARRLGGNAPPLSDDIDISTPYAVERAAALAVAAFLIHVGRQPIRDVTGIRAPSREEVLRRLFVGTA